MLGSRYECELCSASLFADFMGRSEHGVCFAPRSVSESVSIDERNRCSGDFERERDLGSMGMVRKSIGSSVIFGRESEFDDRDRSDELLASDSRPSRPGN